MLHNTLKKIRARRDGEEGFTLIELMVVVLIIAILIAIAIPTFLGAKTRAQDKAAQSNLRNGITAAKTVFSDHQDYADATANNDAALTQVEPSLIFVSAATQSADPKHVSVDTADSDNGATPQLDTVYMTSRATDGNCFAARDVQSASNAGTQYAKVGGSAADCSASAAKANGGLTWGDGF